MIAPVRRFFIRVCIEPRLLPGVRCSVLKTEYRSPSCWITMPGRRRVALTLLIVFLRPESGRAPVRFLAFSGVPAADRSARRRARKSHEARWRLQRPSAKKQYRRADLRRSIAPGMRRKQGGIRAAEPASLPTVTAFRAMLRRLRHDSLDFIRVARQSFAQEFVARLGDEKIVFDANAQVFFGNIDAGLNGDDLAGLQRRAGGARVVNIKSDVVAEAVNKILDK